jgi:uncharacterized membrane protein YgcG
MRRPCAPALALALVLLPAAAAARSLAIERFDTLLTLRSDGALTVTETLHPRFGGQWNGIWRSIPVDYETPQGLRFHLRLHPLSITDGARRALRWEASRQGWDQKLKVWVPDARDATRTVVLRYAVANAVRFFPDHDELYWNVTGNGWEAPIEEASARMILPPRATGVHATAYTGRRGARGTDAQVTVLPDGEVRVQMLRALGMHEGLTVVVGWDKGAVPEPGPLARAVNVVRDNWPLALPLAILPLMFALWRAYGRDPERRPVAVRYEPPAALTPAEAAALVDNDTDKQDVSATLVDLAVRGFLEIDEPIPGEYVFQRRRSPADWEALAGHESRLLCGIFGGHGESVPLAELKNEFHTHLPGIKRAIVGGLMKRGYYRTRPTTVRNGWLVGAAALGIVIGCGSQTSWGALAAAPSAFVIGGIASALLVAAFALVMPARTIAGTRALEAVLGFREFLSRVDGDRYRRQPLTPELFDRFLPYAMAFGVERKWAAAFREIYRTPPTWYHGPARGYAFDSDVLTQDLSRLGQQANTVFASTPPQASGGSGFSGGGFSGGGFGGGGGGGF